MEQAGETMRCGRIQTQGFRAVRIFCICSCLMTIGCGSSVPPQQGGYAEGLRQPASWLQLTRENITSKLKEHEFSLLVATLPWCGESKSLMKDIQKVVKEDPHSFPGLQLFFVHTNKDTLLGKAISGNSIPPSFTLFRYGTPFKYTGQRSTSSIMASIRQGMTVLRSESLLGRIESPQDLEIFADSTDKAVVLFEFCGWEMKLKQKQQNAGITDDFESVNSEEVLNESEIPGRGENNKNEALESSNLDGANESSSKASENSYRTQSGEKQSKTESLVEKIGHEDRLPMVDASLGETFKESVGQSDRRIGDELDDIADCMSQNALYCTFGNACQNLEHATLKDTNPGDNLETAGAKDLKIEGPQGQLLCTSEEYETFKVVYGNVTKLAADNILTPRRIRFANAANAEIASHVGISTQGRPWFLMYLIRDFDRLPYSFNGLGTVEDFLFDHSPPLVFELEGEGHNSASSALLNDTPSVILFIDRMSNSQDVREKSKTALDALQELSYHYSSLANHGGQNGRQRRKQKVKKKPISEVKETLAADLLGEQRTVQMVDPVELLSLLEKPKLHTGLLQNAGGKFVFQLLTDQHQLWNKISGKDALLGNMDMILAKFSQLKLLEEKVRQGRAGGGDSWLLPNQLSQDQLQSDNRQDIILGHRCYEDSSNHCPLSNEQMNEEGFDDLGSNEAIHIFDVDGEEQHECTAETDCAGEEEGKISSSELSDSGRLLLLPEGENGGSAVANDEDKSSDIRREACTKFTSEEDVQHFVVDEDNESSTSRNELGFYFIDGEDPMKEKLARGRETPALVIIDPERQAHYRFPSDVLNVTTLSSFVDSFLSGVLRKTVFSEPERPPPRQPPMPPFVNQDFHEMYPVPRVTVDSFLELVKGVSRADEKCNQFTLDQSGPDSEEGGGNLTESAWDRDVLVLFTTPWCGFCKRMELVVGEVYRSLQLAKGHEDPSPGGINNSDEQQNLNDPTAPRPARFADDHFNVQKAVHTRRVDVAVHEPVLLQMDCTMNDCSHLGEILEEETYPALVLFPARNKLSPVIFSGAPTVRGIYGFLKVHGAASSSAEKQEGNSLNENLAIREYKVCPSTNEAVCDKLVGSTSIKIGSGPGRGSKHEAATLLWELNSRHMDVGKHIEVGSMLLASQKLSDGSPDFWNSIILIVSSNQQGMVHGLIVNKPMPWNNVVGLDSRMEDLLNPAALGYGGPVVEKQRPFLVLTHLQGLEEFTEVIPGIYCGFIPSQGRILEMIHTGRLAAKDFWFFLGYSSWTWPQLQSELTGDMWQVRPFSNELVTWPIQWRT